MRYKVQISVNGEIVEKQIINSDSPAMAVTTVANYLLRSNTIDMFEAKIINEQGVGWYMVVQILHDSKEFKIVTRKKING